MKSHLVSEDLRSVLCTLLLMLAIALGGCTAMQVQNPHGELKPVNAVAGPGGESLMLKGHDVVAYHTLGRHAMGNAAYSSVYQSVTFWFINADHKKLFDAEPTKYLPAYGGFCTNGIVYGIPWGGDADSWVMFHGKVYIFGGAASRDATLLDWTTNLGLAERYWHEEVKASHSFLQRAKRMVIRVPHYKSGAELAAEVAAAKRVKAN